MAFLHAFSGIFSLLIIVGAGYYLASAGWFPAPCRKLLPRLVTNVSLPPFLACTIVSSFSRDNLLFMFYGSLLPLLAISILFCGAYAAGRLMHVHKNKFGLFCACVSNSNTMFIGIPVNMALFGPEAIPCVLLYYFPSTFFFWTVGNYFISRDESATHPRDSAFHWQQIISPPMYGFTIGLLLVVFDVPVPDFLFRSAQLVGDMTTPLALIFIGVTLEGMKLSQIHFSREITVALIGRMVASPLVMWALLPLFDLPELVSHVFVIQSALPVLMQVAILSAYYDTDPDFGSIMVCLSTILCVVSVPVWMSLL